LTENGYVALGSETAVAAAEARKAILEVAPTTEETAKRLDDLQEAAQVKRTPAQDAIKQLVADGVLCEAGGRVDDQGNRKGVRNNPVRYWRPPAEDEIDSAAIKGGVAAESIREPQPAAAALATQPEIDSAATPSLYTAETISGEQQAIPEPPAEHCLDCNRPSPNGLTPCDACIQRARTE
jgi:hypothetical protein